MAARLPVGTAQAAGKDPKSLRIAVLIDRTATRKTQLVPEWAAFRIEAEPAARRSRGDAVMWTRGEPPIGGSAKTVAQTCTPSMRAKVSTSFGLAVATITAVSALQAR